MPGWNSPLFINKPVIGLSNTITVANTTKDLTNSGGVLVFQSNTTFGSYLDVIRGKPLGNSNTSVLRIFINNGQTVTEPNNSVLYTEATLPNIFLNDAVASWDFIWPMKIPLPPGANVYLTMGTATPNGWTFMAVGGDYNPGSMPIFVHRAQIKSNTQLAGNITKDLSTGTIPPPIFTANSANGSFLDHIRMKPLGTNVTTCARIFFNDGEATTVTNNNCLFTEVTLPAITVSEVASQNDVIIAVKTALPPNWNVYALLSQTVAAGWTFTAFGGDY